MSRDVYTKAIGYFSRIYREKGEDSFKDAVFSAWIKPRDIRGGSLFGYASPSRNYFNYDNTVTCGCLTQIKILQEPGPTPELTQAILDDPNIPEKVGDIHHPSQLRVFAQWQRRLDRELNREPLV